VPWQEEQIGPLSAILAPLAKEYLRRNRYKNCLLTFFVDLERGAIEAKVDRNGEVLHVLVPKCHHIIEFYGGNGWVEQFIVSYTCRER
jgi:hypothetical protein